MVGGSHEIAHFRMMISLAPHTAANVELTAGGGGGFVAANIMRYHYAITFIIN